jgi:hypothetical protein
VVNGVLWPGYLIPRFPLRLSPSPWVRSVSNSDGTVCAVFPHTGQRCCSQVGISMSGRQTRPPGFNVVWCETIPLVKPRDPWVPRLRS